MTAAAFFDLDRTLLRGASGPVLSQAMRHAGILGDRSLPGEDLVYRLFNAVGETRPSMVLARQGARFSAGQVADAVRQAGRSAATTLVSMVEPYALPIIAEHRAQGRPVVLATTSPYDLVSPFAEALGLDDVVATRYRVGEDGRYVGEIDGHFVWSAGKLAAVRDWAEANGVDVAASWAYSDSFYDMPLLSAVAHPTVVNPDPRMRIAAGLRRWPVRWLDKPAGVPKLFGVEPAQVLQPFTRPETFPFARFDLSGVDAVPSTGGCILVANHRSYFDVVAMHMVAATAGRPVRFLGKKEVFDVPVVGQLARAMGGIRVDRGTGSDEPLEEAAAALAAGEMVMLMPQGTIPRGPAFFDPVLRGRWGAARLAAMTRSPVIPIGLWGTEAVWPRSSRLPHVWNVADPPLVTISVGAPVELKYRSPNADTERIMRAIGDLLPPESAVRRDPTAAELAATYPPGYDGDPDTEVDRRPGSDT